MDALMTPNPRLKALNAALPHIGPHHQKKLAMMIKMIEMIEIYRNYDTMQAQNTASDENWRRNVINAVMPHVGEAGQQKLRTLLQFIEMQDIIENFEKFKEMSEWMQAE